MPRELNDPYILVFKKIANNPVVWDKPYSKTQAWLWMLFQARAVDNGVLQRGELLASQYEMSKTFGWSRSSVTNFIEALKRAKMIEYREIDNNGLDLNNQARFKQGISKIKAIMVLNFKDYQGDFKHVLSEKKARKVTLKKLSINKNKEDIIPPSAGDTPKSDNSQVYERYIELRRQDLDNPQWKPTDNQAIQMRSNIKKLLESYTTPLLVASLEVYFTDEFWSSKHYPWTGWVKDPAAWIAKKPSRDPNRPLSPEQYIKLPESASVEQPNS